jgi:hypothetical protein
MSGSFTRRLPSHLPILARNWHLHEYIGANIPHQLSLLANLSQNQTYNVTRASRLKYLRMFEPYMVSESAVLPKIGTLIECVKWYPDRRSPQSTTPLSFCYTLPPTFLKFFRKCSNYRQFPQRNIVKLLPAGRKIRPAKLKYLDSHLCQAIMHHTNSCRCGKRKIDDPISLMGAAIIDPNVYLLAVFKVGHSDKGPERI